MDYVAIDQKQIDNLAVRIHNSRSSMGADAAELVGNKIKALLGKQDFVNMIFAAAPSQTEFLQYLRGKKDIEWTRVNAFHMDEYLGLPPDAVQRFANFLKSNIFDKVPFHTVNYLLKDSTDDEGECQKYSDLLNSYPPDIVCMGIGENAHIAFNDPHVARFNDSVSVKVVELDERCRMQQVNDGCFEDIDDVPVAAITLTIPALMKASHIFCVVPGVNKAEAVYHTLTSEIQEKYPSTILRTHDDATLFLDRGSASKLS